VSVTEVGVARWAKTFKECVADGVLGVAGWAWSMHGKQT